MSKPLRRYEVWRFQRGQTTPAVVTGMTHDRRRFGFWPLDEAWCGRFEDRTTIYLKTVVGPGWDKPTVAVLSEATLQDWQNG
jgi:hypothetical protein